MFNSKRLNILFIHYDLPAQFQHLIHYLTTQTCHSVYAICQPAAPQAGIDDKQINLLTYKSSVFHNAHHYVKDLQQSVCNAQAVVRLLQQCKQRGVQFDLAVAHTGWGEALYFKHVYPETPLLGYVEFFYQAQGADAGFDPDFPISHDDVLRIKTLNAQLLLGMTECDKLVTPTYWQKSLFPKIWRPQIEVIHEGVDVVRIKPDPSIAFTLPNGTTLTKHDEVITYSARNLEPYRGFHVFIKAVELICKRRPDCHVVITGGDEVSYSKRLADGNNYRTELLKTVSIAEDRVHFLGSVPYSTHLQLLQLSSAHIYLTYPFVLSWSFIEAMASGCVLIASDTAPVMEVLRPGVNGLTVNFFDYEQIADQVDKVFADPQRLKLLGDAARETVMKHYRHSFSVNHYLTLFQQLLEPVHA